MNFVLKEVFELFIVTYNRDRYLENTLNAILCDDSPVKDCNITIFNNCSTDNTDIVIEEFRIKHPHIKHVKNLHNINGNANIAKAFEHAQKKYFWILCDDDEYDWSGWGQVESAIELDYDAIIVANYGNPEKSIGKMLKQMTFVPATIYKSEIITSTVMNNIEFCISTMFPHLAPACSIINDNKKVYICREWIVNMVPHEGIESYVKGCSVEDMHPYQSQMFWSVGYVNACQMIKSPQVRKEILFDMSEDLKCEKFTNAMKILALVNKRHRGGYSKNIIDAMYGLQGVQKLILSLYYLVSLLPESCIYSLMILWSVLKLVRGGFKS